MFNDVFACELRRWNTFCTHHQAASQKLYDLTKPFLEYAKEDFQTADDCIKMSKKMFQHAAVARTPLVLMSRCSHILSHRCDSCMIVVVFVFFLFPLIGFEVKGQTTPHVFLVCRIGWGCVHCVRVSMCCKCVACIGGSNLVSTLCLSV